MEVYDLDEKKLGELADAKDMTLLQAKLYIGALQNLRKELENVKVTEGYKLTVTIIHKGNKLDEPLEQETTMYVYKVDGRWICEESLEYVFSFMH